MKKIVPIVVMIFSVIAAILSIYGLVLSIMAKFSQLIVPFALVTIITGFTMSVLCCTTGLFLKKSKICLASGILTTVSAVISAIAFILLL